MTLASAHSAPFVTVTRHDGGVALLTFGRSEAMNSFDGKVMGEIRAAFNALLEDPSVRAMVLTGTGKAFSTGADVKQFHAAIQERASVQWVLDATAQLHPLLLDLQRSAKPLIAAVNGVAAGGGLGLALVADQRIGTNAARFAAGYFGLGLSPDGGSTWLLPRLIGEQRTRQFFFTNEVMPAETAFELGLLDEMVEPDQLVPRALEVARQWGAWAEASRESTRRLLAAQSSNTFEGQLDLERGLIASAAGTADFRTGVAAFVGKTKATFG